MNKIKEQKDLIECLEREIEEQKKENVILRKSTDNTKRMENALRAEIKEIEENLRAKTVDEKDYEKMQNKFLLNSAFFKCRIIKVENNKVVFNFLFFTVHYNVMGSIKVVCNLKNEFLIFYCNVLNGDEMKPSHFLSKLSLLYFYYLEIIHMEKKYFVDVNVNEQVFISIKIPNIRSEEKVLIL